jgi:hypothetical protein
MWSFAYLAEYQNNQDQKTQTDVRDDESCLTNPTGVDSNPPPTRPVAELSMTSGDGRERSDREGEGEGECSSTS